MLGRIPSLRYWTLSLSIHLETMGCSRASGCGYDIILIVYVSIQWMSDKANGAKPFAGAEQGRR